MSAREMENIKANVVINYDFPDNMEEYDSRLKLVNGCFLWSWFSTSKDEKMAEEVIKVLLDAKQKVNKSLIQCWLDYENSKT